MAYSKFTLPQVLKPEGTRVGQKGREYIPLALESRAKHCYFAE
jgi:hypothetical protein